MAEYLVTEAAAGDLREIDAYLMTTDGPDAAERVLHALVTSFDRLAEHRLLGHARPDLIARPFRFWPVMGFLIVYDPAPTPIHVIRVLRGSRDIAGILAG